MFVRVRCEMTSRRRSGCGGSKGGSSPTSRRRGKQEVACMPIDHHLSPLLARVQESPVFSPLSCRTCSDHISFEMLSMIKGWETRIRDRLEKGKQKSENTFRNCTRLSRILINWERRPSGVRKKGEGSGIGEFIKKLKNGSFGTIYHCISASSECAYCDGHWIISCNRLHWYFW